MDAFWRCANRKVRRTQIRIRRWMPSDLASSLSLHCPSVRRRVSSSSTLLEKDPLGSFLLKFPKTPLISRGYHSLALHKIQKHSAWVAQKPAAMTFAPDQSACFDGTASTFGSLCFDCVLSLGSHQQSRAPSAVLIPWQKASGSWCHLLKIPPESSALVWSCSGCNGSGVYWTESCSTLTSHQELCKLQPLRCPWCWLLFCSVITISPFQRRHKRDLFPLKNPCQWCATEGSIIIIIIASLLKINYPLINSFLLGAVFINFSKALRISPSFHPPFTINWMLVLQF